MVRELKVFPEVITLLTRDVKAGEGVVRREGDCTMERSFRSPAEGLDRVPRVLLEGYWRTWRDRRVCLRGEEGSEVAGPCYDRGSGWMVVTGKRSWRCEARDLRPGQLD